jgi:hypothetical protein
LAEEFRRSFTRHSKGPDMAKYKPGETVPDSGIYQARHDSHHKEHDVTCIRGARFPACKNCQRVRFILIRRAEQVDHHPEFAKGAPLDLSTA